MAIVLPSPVKTITGIGGGDPRPTLPRSLARDGAISESGDPRLIFGPDGSRLQFTGGQPLMDRGWENFVLISLFTAPGWCGNRFLPLPIGSDFEAECNKPITRETLNRVRNAAERALNHKVLGKVTVSVTNPSGYRLIVAVAVEQSGTTLTLTRDGGHWSYQIDEPAHRRIQ